MTLERTSLAQAQIHEKKVTLADVCYGRRPDVLSKRARIKQLIIQRRRTENQTASVA
jgi:hypothetical protein